MIPTLHTVPKYRRPNVFTPDPLRQKEQVILDLKRLEWRKDGRGLSFDEWLKMDKPTI